jgi:hypothetical protein
MSQINLTNWEIVDDVQNGKVIIRSKVTGNQLELSESGELSTSTGIDADTLDGEELSTLFNNSPEFNDGLRIAEGQAIEDDNGNARLTLDSSATTVDTPGNDLFLNRGGTTGLRVRGDHVLVDSTDLRLSTGQAIEDGSGTKRFSILPTGFRTRMGNGDVAFQAFDENAGTSEVAIESYNGVPITFQDNEGAFTAVQYNTSSSAPGTLELTNALLKYGRQSYSSNTTQQNSELSSLRLNDLGKSGDSDNISQSLFFRTTNNDGSWIRCNSGELEGVDTVGNTTTLT